MSESEYENIFRRKELHDMYALGEIKPLDDLYLIEDVALTVKELNKKIDFYKDYKKKKAEDIKDAIKVLENQIEFYKSVMVSTLKQHNEKSVKFPGSCSVSSRNQKAKWSINDEDEFIAVLKEARKSGENVDDVLEEFTQYNIRKKEADKLLNLWEQSGKLEDFLKKARKGSGKVVNKEDPKTSVSIKYIQEVEDEDEVEEVSVPVKTISNEIITEGYDSI